MKFKLIKVYVAAIALGTASAAALAAETGALAQAAPASSAMTNNSEMADKSEMPMRHGMMHSKSADGAQGTRDNKMMEHHGMMQGDGMMGMMRGCHQMMAAAQSRSELSLPHLPPGNDKLDFQMRAEMMQKIGEIAVKYADKTKESP